MARKANHENAETFCRILARYVRSQGTLTPMDGCHPKDVAQIQSQISPSENKGNKDLHSAKRDQTRQNTHTGRTRKDEGGR